MTKIVAFSLWGNNPKYCVGAIRNAELAKQHYPGWTCRFYVPNRFLATELQPGLFIGDELTKTVDILLSMHNVEIVSVNEPADWHGMFWRFRPASEDVDVFISRDCDSRISAREAAAVKEWLASPQLVHSMADHPYHFHPKAGLMGGMFGMKRYACLEMVKLIEDFKAKYPDAWQCDQDFLKQHIYPLVAHKIYATSDIHQGCHRFPLPRDGGAFVGEIIGANEEILHPEHREIR